MSVSTGDPFVEKLVESKIVPDNCRRAIIDCCVGKATKLYYECYGDEKMLEIFPFDSLSGVEVRTAGSGVLPGEVEEMGIRNGYMSYRRKPQ